MSFKFGKLDLPGPILVESNVFGDDRGFFQEVYKHTEFVDAGMPEHFVQDNHSQSAKNVLRGLHYQKNPKEQAKLVRCIAGAIYDVAVDIRRGSPTFGKWAAVELSGENKKMLYIPAGFAHGFLTLSDRADVLYKCTGEYSPENDRGVIWNDPDIAISWNIGEPLLSGKDAKHPRLRDADINFIYHP